MKLLCRIGFHRWTFATDEDWQVFDDAEPDQIYSWNEKCILCGNKRKKCEVIFPAW